MRCDKYSKVNQYYMIGHSTGLFYTTLTISGDASHNWPPVDNTLREKLKYHMSLGMRVLVFKYEDR